MPGCFFFSSRRRHTRYWRDWSSDVCSSDLNLPLLFLSTSVKMQRPPSPCSPPSGLLGSHFLSAERLPIVSPRSQKGLAFTPPSIFPSPTDEAVLCLTQSPSVFSWTMLAAVYLLASGAPLTIGTSLSRKKESSQSLSLLRSMGSPSVVFALASLQP